MTFAAITCEYTGLTVVARRTSDPDVGYNCVAWAFGKTDINWWPDFPSGGWGWPIELVGTGYQLQEFEHLFATWGWERVSSDVLEVGYDKIALYVDEEGSPRHLARMLVDDARSSIDGPSLWTSKLGSGIDVTHELGALAGADRFGSVHAIYRKCRTAGSGMS